MNKIIKYLLISIVFVVVGCSNSSNNTDNDVNLDSLSFKVGDGSFFELDATNQKYDVTLPTLTDDNSTYLEFVDKVLSISASDLGLTESGTDTITYTE